MTNKELKRLHDKINKARNERDMLKFMVFQSLRIIHIDDYRHLLWLAKKYHVRIKKQEVGVGI